LYEPSISIEPSGNSVTNGPCRVPSGRAQYHVGSGIGAGVASVPSAQVSFGAGGASGGPASTGGSSAGGRAGWPTGVPFGVAAPEPQAAAHVKPRTTVWKRTTPHCDTVNRTDPSPRLGLRP